MMRESTAPQTRQGATKEKTKVTGRKEKEKAPRRCADGISFVHLQKKRNLVESHQLEVRSMEQAIFGSDSTAVPSFASPFVTMLSSHLRTMTAARNEQSSPYFTTQPDFEVGG